MCVHVILFRIIPHYSDVLPCYMLFAYEQFWFLFTLRKEFINRATLNLSARRNRKFVHYPCVYNDEEGADRLGPLQVLRHPFNTADARIAIARIATLKPLGMTTFSMKTLNLWNSNQWNDHIFLVVSVYELFPLHFKIPKCCERKAEILLFRVSGFFYFNETNSK